MEKDIVNEQLSKTYEGKMYLQYKIRHSQTAEKMERDVKEIIAQNGLTATYAKGFLNYMKMVIDGCSVLQKE